MVLTSPSKERFVYKITALGGYAMYMVSKEVLVNVKITPP